jgi:Ca2+-binding EF-hand superfamily protein
MISTKELMTFLKTTDASMNFCERVFTLFDEDESGQIDFREFVVAMWNYCTLSRSSLIVFAFDLYDTDETGELSPPEIQEMLKDLYGEHANTNAHAKHVRKEILSLDRRTFFTIDKFRDFVRSHPALLFPAFQMQLALQTAIMGVSFWTRCSTKRVRLADGRRVRVEIIKSMNTQDYMHRKVIATDAVPVTEGSERHTLRPKQQVATLILQATGTLHYRRGDMHRNKRQFLTAAQQANHQYVIQSYAQSKLQGLQPWRRHTDYVGPSDLPTKRKIPVTSTVESSEQKEETSLPKKQVRAVTSTEKQIEVSSTHHDSQPVDPQKDSKAVKKENFFSKIFTKASSPSLTPKSSETHTHVSSPSSSIIVEGAVVSFSVPEEEEDNVSCSHHSSATHNSHHSSSTHNSRHSHHHVSNRDHNSGHQSSHHSSHISNHASNEESSHHSSHRGIHLSSNTTSHSSHHSSHHNKGYAREPPDMVSNSNNATAKMIQHRHRQQKLKRMQQNDPTLDVEVMDLD